jgi:hypothetical protein
MTKTQARALAQVRATDQAQAVVRHKSKFTVMSLSRARAEGFYVMETIKPSPRQFCGTCGASLTSTDVENQACTQCGAELKR